MDVETKQAIGELTEAVHELKGKVINSKQGLNKQLLMELAEVVNNLGSKLSDKKWELNKQLVIEETKKSIIQAIEPIIQNSKIMVEIVGKLESENRITIAQTTETITEAIKSAVKEIKIEVPEIKIPNIVIPKIEAPAVNVPLQPRPHITVKASDVKPKIDFPKVTEVKGIGSLIKGVFALAKETLNVKIGDVSTKSPLPVILVYKGKEYAGIGGMGGPSRIFIKNKLNATVNPVSEGHDTIGDGVAIATPAGTATPFSVSSVPCKRVWIQASEENIGIVVIGGSTVTATPVASVQGRFLFRTQGEWFYPSNLNLLYIDGAVSGNKVSYYYEN